MSIIFGFDSTDKFSLWWEQSQLPKRVTQENIAEFYRKGGYGNFAALVRLGIHRLQTPVAATGGERCNTARLLCCIDQPSVCRFISALMSSQIPRSLERAMFGTRTDLEVVCQTTQANPIALCCLADISINPFARRRYLEKAVEQGSLLARTKLWMIETAKTQSRAKLQELIAMWRLGCCEAEGVALSLYMSSPGTRRDFEDSGMLAVFFRRLTPSAKPVATKDETSLRYSKRDKIWQAITGVTQRWQLSIWHTNLWIGYFLRIVAKERLSEEDLPTVAETCFHMVAMTEKLPQWSSLMESFLHVDEFHAVLLRLGDTLIDLDGNLSMYGFHYHFVILCVAVGRNDRALLPNVTYVYTTLYPLHPNLSEYPDSVMAASFFVLIGIAAEWEQPIWSEKAIRYTGLQLSDIRECIVDIHAAVTSVRHPFSVHTTYGTISYTDAIYKLRIERLNQALQAMK